MGSEPGRPQGRERKSAALKLAEEVQRRPFATAAIVGGAAAACSQAPTDEEA